MKKSMFFLVMLSLLTNVCAIKTDNFASTVFYKGDLSFSLGKETYTAGELLETNLTVSNMEDFPIVDGRLIIEVVKGGPEHVYPSQLYDSDNVLYEEVVENINLAPRSRKTLQFSYEIPEDMQSGGYRLEVYFRTDRTPVVGIPHIFMSPRHESFQVNGGGSFPSASIVRTKTVYAGQEGPVGAGVDPGSVVKGNVHVMNNGPSRLEGASLRVSVCEWDDTLCDEEELYFRQEYGIDPIEAGAVRVVEVEFKAPEEAEAYSIRMELEDRDGRMLSLYRNRIIVKGETGRIRKMALSKLHYSEGEDALVRLLVSGSPDHYTLPVVLNAKVSVQVKDDAGLVHSDSFVIPELSAAQGFVEKSFVFRPQRELESFEVCSKIESESGKTYDAYCYFVNPSKILPKENVINAEWDYDSGRNTLEINLCATDSSGMRSRTEASVILSAPDMKEVHASLERVLLDSCRKVSFDVGAGEYLLVVNDLKDNRQFVSTISVVIEEASKLLCGNGRCEVGEDPSACCSDCGCSEGKKCVENACIEFVSRPVCGNGRCEVGEDPLACCSDCGCPSGRRCAENKCVESDFSEGVDGSLYSMLLVVAAIIILLLMFYAYNRKQKRPAGKKGRTGK
ncbi:MAG: hypothetical protein JW724_06565 [Candidatus Altiarchaeota archaeon]|nr:hypothetical protein [Candidatus Altiarchaeota archaeon]